MTTTTPRETGDTEEGVGPGQDQAADSNETPTDQQHQDEARALGGDGGLDEPPVGGASEGHGVDITTTKDGNAQGEAERADDLSASPTLSAPPPPPPPPPPPLPSTVPGQGRNHSYQVPNDVPKSKLPSGGLHNKRPVSEPPLPPNQQEMSQLKLDDQKRRKSSAVSFKDVYELFEIDLEANNADKPKKPAAVFSLRYYVMILALVSPFMVTYSKTIINFAIIDMIDPNFLNAHNHNHISKPVQQGAQSSAAIGPFDVLETSTDADDTGERGQDAQHSDNSYFDLDNSCPVDDATRARLDEDLTMDTIRAKENAGEKFEWDTVKQGLLKAAYSIGHMLLQVVGGRLSEIYGTNMITGVGSLLIGLACLFAPFLASAHFYLLFADLFLLGTLGSFMTPALITLFSNWLTPSEKSMMMSLYLVSSRLGYALSSLLCGLLISAHLSWRYLFYSAGWISIIFSVLFVICVRSRPHEHPLMSQEELDYLASKNTLVREALQLAAARAPAKGVKANSKDQGSNGAIQMVTIKRSGMKNGEQKKHEEATGEKMNSQTDSNTGPEPTKAKPATGAPWLAIMTNVPVWAFIVTKFCVKLAGDTVQIELPTYLKRVLHLTPKHNGFVNASNYVIFCISCLVVGMLAKSANKRRPFGWSKTTVRKVFQVTASFGAGLALLGISLCVCQETITLVLLMLMFFFTTFGTGGESQIPLDISERYAGTIHAIGSTLAISGVIEPILVGYILKDYPADRDRWASVWMGASAIAFLGGLVFMLFGDATIQSFDKLDIKVTTTTTSGPTVDVCQVGVAPARDDKASQATVAAKLAELKGHDNETFENVGESESADAREQAQFKESGQI